MASQTTPQSDSGAGLAPDPNAVTPRISLSEVGFSGLLTINGAIIEEQNRAFRYPQFLKTVIEMKTDPTVSAALNVYRMMLTRVDWRVSPPENATESEKQRAKFVESCMVDMDCTWSQFMAEVVTYLEYGFSVQEKVFRRRLTRNGSKYNDGLVGLRKLAPRAQDTIRHWNFSEDGRDLISVGQSIRMMENGARFQNLADPNGLINIDRSKFLLFSADSVKGNPEGKSVLKSVFLPYKQLALLKDQLMLGVSKDIASIPVVYLPPKYMAADASDAEKAVYKAYLDMASNVASGKQRSLVMPQVWDDSGNKQFEFSLMEAKGTNKFDIPKIIEQLQNDILIAMSADVLMKGLTESGSFSIKDTKTNLCAMAMEHRLNEIRDVLNSDLIAQIYALNGWTQERLPTFEYGDIADVDSEAFSKLVQRVASVGLVEIDRSVLNKIREVMGVETLPVDTPVDKENLSAAGSRSGDGMAAGKSGDGTSNIGSKSSKQDKSARNADNKG
jgi:hypothetical protein